jgi:hydroxymethylpyrimidine pyrophosphatase-like HAD family hydrolase/energy-coupling factor transporter ATP-binding protein EcfA2
MAGMMRAVAMDLDGTIAWDDRVHPAVLDALAEVREAGISTLLVTGRTLESLDTMFAGLRDLFDAVVAENGAVLDIDGVVHDQGERLGPVLSGPLAAAGVAHAVGRVLIGCAAADASSVHEVIETLGMDYQVVHNRSQLMVLPAGLSKGTGLVAALHELGLSAHNVVAVGDAENDLALLHTAEIGVAVANALPSVKDQADIVLDEPNGAGVAALLRGPIVAGRAPAQVARRRISIGTYPDGTETTVPGGQANILITGDSGSGKSHLAGVLVERWIDAGYTALVVDIEGDYVGLGHLNHVVVLGGHEPPPSYELVTLLRQASVSVVLDLSAVHGEQLATYLTHLPTVIEGERAAWGLPHWVVLDEAHATLGRGGAVAEMIRPSDLGYCLVTYHPDELSREVSSVIDVRIVTMGSAARSGRGAATIVEGGGAPRHFETGDRRTVHVRHWHKYTSEPLPREHRFVFRNPDGSVVATAANIAEFVQYLRTLDSPVIAYHLTRGDISRWLVGCLGNRDLAAEAATVERDILSRQAAEVQRARRQLIDAIEQYYWLQNESTEGPTP